jgi:hypothetical protein
MDKRRSRAMLLAAGLLALGLAGATGIAVAQSNRSNPPPARELDESPGKPSSVTVPPSQAATEADEGTALQGLAKITADQAKAAALAAAPGNATKVELENEDGNLVYKVEVVGADGKQTDLEIDAGNASVLSKETEAADTESGDNESVEASETAGENEATEAPEKPETNDQHQADEAGEAPEAPGD